MYVRLKFKARHNIAPDDYADISCIIFSWFDCHFYRAYRKEVNAFAIMTEEEVETITKKLKNLKSDYEVKLKVFDTREEWELCAMRETNAPYDVFARAFEY